MKAWEIGSPATLESLRLCSRPDPKSVAADEILVRIRATSINFHDIAVVTGLLPAAGRRIPISDGAGRVVATGSDVTEFAVGDQVISTFFPGWLDGQMSEVALCLIPGDGVDGYAREYAKGPVTAFTRAPAGYSDAEAATLPCADVTAWRALMVAGGLKAGETVLVQGSGGVATFALQIAKTVGAKVIAISSSDEKLARLLGLGADHLINYRSTPAWGSEVRRLVPQGVDHVVEIGGAGTLTQSVEAAALGGRISMIGFLG